MLARPEQHHCVECGLTYGSDRFHYYHGRIEEGPAYWSDRGLLCSPGCALAHQKKRAADGTLGDAPAPYPFEIGFPGSNRGR